MHEHGDEDVQGRGHEREGRGGQQRQARCRARGRRWRPRPTRPGVAEARQRVSAGLHGASVQGAGLDGVAKNDDDVDGRAATAVALDGIELEPLGSDSTNRETRRHLHCSCSTHASKEGARGHGSDEPAGRGGRPSRNSRG